MAIMLIWPLLFLGGAVATLLLAVLTLVRGLWPRGCALRAAACGQCSHELDLSVPLERCPECGVFLRTAGVMTKWLGARSAVGSVELYTAWLVFSGIVGGILFSIVVTLIGSLTMFQGIAGGGVNMTWQHDMILEPRAASDATYSIDLDATLSTGGITVAVAIGDIRLELIPDDATQPSASMVIDAASSGWYVETPADIAAGGSSTASGSPVDRDAVVAWFEAGGLNTGAAARETEIDAIADGLAAGLAQPWQFNMAIEDPQGALTNWTTPNTASVLVSTRNVPTAPNLPGMTSFFNPADLIAGGVWLRLTTAGRGDEPVAAGA